jgi:hypothetical protein
MIDTSNLVPAGTQDQPVWVSGGSYVVGQQVVSPTSYKIYVRKTIGGGATDPSADTTNWSVRGLISTKSIKNYFSTAGYTAQTIDTKAASAGGAIAVNSGALTANTLATVFSATGAGVSMPHLTVRSADATARTLRVVVEVDGVAAYDYTSASFSSTGAGCCLAGVPRTVLLAFEPIRSSSSLVVKIASNLTETDKFIIEYAYQEVL